jgi:hypothetical protein
MDLSPGTRARPTSGPEAETEKAGIKIVCKMEVVRSENPFDTPYSLWQGATSFLTCMPLVAGKLSIFCGDVIVAKPEWGTKQQCPKCGTRFYDLKPVVETDAMVLDEVTCIECSNIWRPEPILKSKQPLPYEEQIQAQKASEGDADVADVADDLDIEDIGDDSSGDVSLDDDDAELDDVVDPKTEDD